MKKTLLKIVVGFGLVFATGASFAQEFTITCPNDWCKCDGSVGGTKDTCCGRNSCEQLGTSCFCS